MNSLLNKISVLVAYVIMVGLNVLAVALPLAGRDTGSISDSFPNLFAPAGFTFSIWSIIYSLLLVYVIYQFTRTKDKLIAKVNHLFIINALLNAAWIFSWHYLFLGISVFIMVGLLFTLIKIADVLREEQLTTQQTWLVRLPFSIYFGWITVATIANITTLLVSINWSGFGLSEVFWTVLILLVGTAIGIWRLQIDRFFPYGLVLVWAYGGILAKHVSSAGFAGAYPAVIATVLLCILLQLIATAKSLT